jgi:hypothetical protein
MAEIRCDVGCHERLQILEFRQRLALTVLEDLKQRVIAMALDVTSIAGATEIIAGLEQISCILSGEVMA